MRYTVRLVDKRRHDLCWTRIEGWGYPADLEDFDEVVMVEVGDGGAYFWFEWLSQTDLLLHMAAHMAHRGRFFTRRVRERVYVTAELLGADRLWVVTEDTTVNRYVERLGWEHDPTQGWYKRITA